MLLIHHTGARSRIERVTPLAHSHQPDRRLAIVATNGGSPNHPDWHHNLKANPVITVEVGTQTFTAVAEERHGTARAEPVVEAGRGVPPSSPNTRPRPHRRFRCSR